MLELYHAEPGANSLKVMVAIKEKGVPFESRYMRLNKFEQHEPWFVKINPMGQVPVLVHDGKVINESTVINEYLDAAFEGPALRPADPYGKARMRIWTKFVDEYFCPALSHLGWHRIIKAMVEDLTPEEFEEKLARIPLKEQRDKWRLNAVQGARPEQLEEWTRQVKVSIERVEKGLADSPWLVGDAFTLADVAVFAMAHNMNTFWGTMVNEKDTPRLTDWLKRMHARPGVIGAFSMPNRLREDMDAKERAKV